MEDISTPIVGGVYQTDLSDNPVRVLAFDRIQLFYDVWWSNSQDWCCKRSLSGKVFFYRTLTQQFIKASKLLSIEPFNEQENLVYKFNLPFSICRNNNIAWTSKRYPDMELFKTEMAISSVHIEELETLSTSEVILVPFGPKGGYKKSIAIKAANGKYFSGIELLWGAHNIQSAYIKGVIENGVGLYRLGFENGLPSFYIGGFYDNANFLKSSS